MASISHDKKTGRRTIQFVGKDGRRRSVRLGKVGQKQAESAKRFIEDLVACKVTGTAPKNATAEWLAGLPAMIRRRIERAGLVEPEENADCPTLKGWLTRYVESRTDVKVSTRIAWGQTQRFLLGFFGPGKRLDEITPGDADEWRLHLKKQGLADNTIRRRSGVAKQFFNAAKRKRLIDHNPFEDLKSCVMANTARYYFVTREEAKKVLDACPDAQWRLVFALCRFGGLRCPSEIVRLTWSHIDWDNGRMTVPSPKTEHHPGGESRQIPLFPELVPHLQEVFEQAEPGMEFVITRYRCSNQNLGTQLRRIIGRAGLKPWPKLFQNLRSTRETELAEQFPMHVVCTWIGNSQPIAAKHYLQVTAEHFQKAVQNPVQQVAALHRGSAQAPRDVQADGASRTGNDAERGDASLGTHEDISMVGATGLEPVTSWV